MQKITTFFMFNDKAAEAMSFYVSVFKNSKVLSTMPGPEGTVMGGSFQLEGQEFMAYNGGPSFKFEQGMSLFVSCETQAEIDDLWEKLSEGGEKQPCGWVQDKCGVSWQVVPAVLGDLLGGDDTEKSKRVMDALLKMGKLDIKTLQEA
jgi:predicted 3-demethylubiquinone-9 3-methyltransferase (glyoxalase superfamily)